LNEEHSFKPKRCGNTLSGLRVTFQSNRRFPCPTIKVRSASPTVAKVATDEDYEVNQLAQKYGISSAQARELIERFGNNRENLYAAAEMLNQEA